MTQKAIYFKLSIKKFIFFTITVKYFYFHFRFSYIWFLSPFPSLLLCPNHVNNFILFDKFIQVKYGIVMAAAINSFIDIDTL